MSVEISPYLTVLTRFRSAGSSDTDAYQADFTSLQGTKRKPVTIDQLQLAAEVDALSTPALDAPNEWDGIAGQEALTRLWFCLAEQRQLAWAPELEDAAETPEFSDPSIEGQLKRCNLQYQRGMKGVSKKPKLLAQVLWRLYLAIITSLYLQEKDARKRRKRVRRNRRGVDTASTCQTSLIDTFVDLLLPVLQTGSIDTREKAETRFGNWIQYGKRWAKPVGRYGSGILLLWPRGLTNEK